MKQPPIHFEAKPEKGLWTPFPPHYTPAVHFAHAKTPTKLICQCIRKDVNKAKGSAAALGAVKGVRDDKKVRATGLKYYV